MNLAVRVEVGVEADGAAAGGDELDEGRDRRVRLGEEHVEKEEAAEVGGARGTAIWRIWGDWSYVNSKSIPKITQPDGPMQTKRMRDL